MFFNLLKAFGILRSLVLGSWGGLGTRLSVRCIPLIEVCSCHMIGFSCNPYVLANGYSRFVVHVHT